jgi:predicted enzyme related to lactoylglutathione lyase
VTARQRKDFYSSSFEKQSELHMGIALAKPAIDLGIVTTNGEAMLTFYRDLLGLTYLRSMPMPGGSGTMHQMMCGDSMIKLVVLDSVPTPAAPGGIPGAAGYRYWTITLSNITEMMASCVAAGAKVAMKERELRPGIRIAIVEDPDGNWVEFLALG